MFGPRTRNVSIVPRGTLVGDLHSGQAEVSQHEACLVLGKMEASAKNKDPNQKTNINYQNLSSINPFPQKSQTLSFLGSIFHECTIALAYTIWFISSPTALAFLKPTAPVRLGDAAIRLGALLSPRRALGAGPERWPKRADPPQNEQFFLFSFKGAYWIFSKDFVKSEMVCFVFNYTSVDPKQFVCRSI